MFSLIWAWINQLSKQSRGCWFETPSGLLWRQCSGNMTEYSVITVRADDLAPCEKSCRHIDYVIWIWYTYRRADSRLAPSQWETSLHSNTVSHWLSANLESDLISYMSLGDWNMAIMWNAWKSIFLVKAQHQGNADPTSMLTTLRSVQVVENIKVEVNGSIWTAFSNAFSWMKMVLPLYKFIEICS